MSVKLRSKKLSNNSESLYLDIYSKGSRHYEFLDIKIKKNDPERKLKKQIAETKRSKREIEIISDYNDIPRNLNGGEDFLEYFKVNIKNKSAQSVFNNFSNFVKPKTINGKLPFKLITEKLIEDYKSEMEKVHKNSTAWAYLLKIKTILNKAVKDKLILQSPAKYVKVKLNEIERVYLTKEEIQAMADTETKNIETKRAFIFSCFTGLRISDIKKMTWSEINEDKISFRQMKTKRIEYLPLAKTAIKYLYINIDKRSINQDEKVFKLKQEKTINNEIRKWSKNANINKSLTFHSARHTFATLSLSSGIDIYTVSKMMGHKSIKMTEIYAKIINKTVEEAMTKLPSI